MSIVPRIGLITIAAAGLTLGGSFAPAQAAVDVQTQRPTQTTASPRKICVFEETTGRRIPRKVCRTQAEWDRMGGIPTS